MPLAGIIIPDATSTADLAILAGQVDDHTLPAGAADFFDMLLKIRPHPSPPPNPCPIASLIKPPALLVCGSRIAWPARLAACQAVPMPVVLASGSGTGPLSFRKFLLGIGDQEAADPSAALEKLAAISAAMIEGLEVKTILVEGGATASALAQRMNWQRFQVVAPAAAGIGVLRPLPSDESAAAPLVLIKPGSYPWPAEIWTAFTHLI
jgi:hypothetical protein